MSRLDRESKVPLHEQIAEIMRERISAGQWPVDYRIPSNTTLIEEFGVSPMTLRAALRTLIAEGLLRARQGAGTYVRATPLSPSGAAELSAALVRAIRKLHQPAGSRPMCLECVDEAGQYQTWPCRTEVAIAKLIEA